MSLLKAVATVSGFTMISRVTGFIRDILVAAIIGTGPISDAFFVAFKLPNFFRRLTAEGSLTAAFVPLFSNILEADGTTAAMRFAEQTLAIMAAFLLAFTVAIIFFMPEVLMILAPGFTETPERFHLAVKFSRITFVYLPLISLAALFGGVLNSFGKFAAMASAPILLNLVLISSVAVFANALETPGHVLAYGVAAAGFAQFLWLLEACRRAGVLPAIRKPSWTPQVKRLLHLMLPAMLGAGVVQINLLIDMILASTLPTGSISFLYYADRINQLPLGVVGIAIGTALLPKLSREIGAGLILSADDSQNRALEIGILLTLPAAVGLVVLAEPIVEVLFQRGAFTAISTDLTSLALVAYSTGLPAFVLIKIFQPSFFARHDTATPVKIAILAVSLNLCLNLILMQYFAHVGLAMATAVSAWVNAGMLFFFLHRRNLFRLDNRLKLRIPRIIAATFIMSFALLLMNTLLSIWQDGPLIEKILFLFTNISTGIIIYGLAVLLFQAAPFNDLRSFLKGIPSEDKPMKKQDEDT